MHDEPDPGLGLSGCRPSEEVLGEPPLAAPSPGLPGGGMDLGQGQRLSFLLRDTFIEAQLQLLKLCSNGLFPHF